MKKSSAVGALAMIASVVFAMSEVFGAAASLAVVGVGIAIGWRLVPGFWRAVTYGALGGALAGLVVLGPGLRVAMRVVAIFDPIRRPEFTVDGTMFILIGIGGIMGGLFGIMGATLRNGFQMKSPIAGLLTAAAVMVVIFAADDLRSEIMTLGAGPWLNIPMFTAVAVAYGLASMTVVARLEARREPKKATSELEEVPA